MSGSVGGKTQWRAARRAARIVAMTQTSFAATCPARRVAAARAVDVVKSFGSGPTAVIALDHVDVELRRGEFTAIMGPSGSGKSTLMHCLAGLDTVTSGSVVHRRRRAAGPVGQEDDRAAPRPDRLRVPVVQPRADADRAGEHHAADRRSPAARPTSSGSTSSSTPSACATGSGTARASCPAASSSASPSAARWPAGRRSSSATSRPATSTRAPAARCCASCASRSTGSARPSSS